MPTDPSAPEAAGPVAVRETGRERLPAVQAVIDVLCGQSACTWHVGCDEADCHEPRARAIVAALYPDQAACPPSRQRCKEEGITVNDRADDVGRDAAADAAERIRAYLDRFPNMATVGPAAFDLRDSHGNPYALPVTDLLAVLDRLQKTSRAPYADWTLRDLLRLAHRHGLYLSRARTGYDSQRRTYQVWEPAAEPDPDRPWAAGRRWVEVHYWPARATVKGTTDPGPTWNVRLNGRERPTEDTSHAAHAELWDPTIPEIVGALEWLDLLGDPEPVPATDLRNHLELS